MRKSIIGLMGLAAMAMSTNAKDDTYIYSNPYADLGNAFVGGAHTAYVYSTPIYITYYHPKQTYRGQQRAALKRKNKSKKH